MNVSEEDMSNLVEIIGKDPDFVDQYLGDNKNNAFFTVTQCAKALGITSGTVLYRIKVGGLKAERDNHGYWMVSAKDLRDHIKNGGTQKRFASTKRSKPETKGEIQIMRKGSYRYDRSTSQNVLDFLHHWEKSNTVGFSTTTLTNDFNKVCATETTHGQMSGILSTLSKKKILVRKGRGIYCLHEGFIPKPSNITEAPQPTQIHIPLVEVEAEDTTFDKEELKTEERHLIDKYLARYSDPTEDFVFSISDLAEAYPSIDRKKIGKAVNNMYQNDKLQKGKELGEYVKKATMKAKPVETPEFNRMVRSFQEETANAALCSLEDVLRLNISDELKAKIIKEIMA
jgi:hypothetical protein